MTAPIVQLRPHATDPDRLEELADMALNFAGALSAMAEAVRADSEAIAVVAAAAERGYDVSDALCGLTDRDVELCSSLVEIAGLLAADARTVLGDVVERPRVWLDREERSAVAGRLAFLAASLEGADDFADVAEIVRETLESELRRLS